MRAKLSFNYKQVLLRGAALFILSMICGIIFLYVYNETKIWWYVLIIFLSLLITFLIIIIIFAKRKQLIKKREVIKPDWLKSIDGIPLNNEITWPMVNIFKHGIIIGTTGCGKTNLILKIIKESKQKIILVNGKYSNGDIYQRIKKLDKKIINFDCKKTGNLYNPLKNKSISEIVTLLLELSNFSNIISKTLSGQDYYLRNEKNFLYEYLELLSAANIDLTLNNIIFNLKQKRINTIAQKLNKEFKFANNEIINAIYVKFMDFFRIKCIANDNNGFSIYELIKSNKYNKIIFDINPTSSLEGKIIGKIIQYDLKQYKDNISAQKAKNILVIMDEFAAYANLYTKNLLEQGRSKKIAILLSLQSSSQLDDVSQTFKKTIFNNSNTLFLFSFYDDVKFISNLLGTKKEIEITMHYDSTKKATHYSSKVVNKNILNDNDIKMKLNIGECLFITQRLSDNKRIWPIKIKIDLT